jgi:hypothetical protein
MNGIGSLLWPRRAVLLGLTAGLLGACSLFEKSAPPPCPHVAMLDEAKSLSLYREGAGRDLTDVTFEGKLGSVQASCEVSSDAGRMTIESKVALVIEATRGPAGQGDALTLPYFIAIVDPDKHILAKQNFEAKLAFTTSKIRTAGIEETEQTIPVSPRYFAGDYEILIGFQLSHEQLQDQRARH